MAKESKTILELDRLTPLSPTDEVPIARGGTESDNKMILEDLIRFNPNKKTITLYGQHTFDVSSLMRYNITIGEFTNGEVDITPSEQPYTYNTQVTLKATADPGYEFVRWIDKDGATIEGGDTLNISVIDNITITPVFSVISTFEIKVTLQNAPEGATAEIKVKENGTWVSKGQSFNINKNEKYKIVVTPPTGYEYEIEPQVSGEIEIVATEDKTYEITFSIIEFVVSANVVGDKGGYASVTDLNGNQITKVQYGGSARFVATPNPSTLWSFDGWYANAQGSGNKLDDTTPHDELDIHSAKSLYAKFKRIGDKDYYIGYVDGGLEVLQATTDSELTENTGKYIEETPSVKLSGLTGEKTIYVIYKNDLSPNVLWKYADNVTRDKSTEFSNHVAPFQYARNNSFTITIDNVVYNIRIAFGVFSSSEEITFNFSNN